MKPESLFDNMGWTKIKPNIKKAHELRIILHCHSRVDSSHVGDSSSTEITVMLSLSLNLLFKLLQCLTVHSSILILFIYFSVSPVEFSGRSE